MKLFDENNSLMEIDEFINKYSNAYFLNTNKICGICYQQTSEKVEKIVLEQSDVRTREGLARILAWKWAELDMRCQKNLEME